MAGRFTLILFLFGSVLVSAQETNRPSFRLGIDVLADGGFRELKGKRVGLVTNPSGVDGNGVPTWKRFRESPNVNLVALYGPEHGVFGKVGAGKHVSGERHGEDKNTTMEKSPRTRKPGSRFTRSTEPPGSPRIR